QTANSRSISEQPIRLRISGPVNSWPLTPTCCLLSTVCCLLVMWDAKRQFIWLAAGLALRTFVAYSDAHDEDGTFVPRFFFFMESLVLIIIVSLCYIYSRKKQK